MSELELNEGFEDEEVESITLEFDDGEAIECVPLFVFDVEGVDYVALVPADEESEDVYLYEYHEISEEEFDLIDIEDDDVFDNVAAVFESILAEDEAAAEEEE